MTNDAQPVASPRFADAIPTLRDEDAARKRIRRNRSVATGLLVGMAAAFAGTWFIPEPGFGTAFLRAGAEAGIIGGLADWFAVTALFRHPLGIPIPHTAILPNSRERIGRALGAFIERGFLTQAAILPRLQAFQPGRRLAAWLSTPENVRAIADPVVATLPQILKAVEKGPLRDYLNDVVGDRLKTIELAPIAGRALEVVTQSGEGDVLFEKAVGFMLRWIELNRAEIDKLVAQRSRWWVPASIDRRIAQTIVESLRDVLSGLHKPDSSTRQRFQLALGSLIESLKNEPDQRQEWNAMRNRLLQHPAVQAWLNAIWTELSTALAEDLVDRRSRTRAVIETALGSIGKVLAAEPDLQARIDRTLEGLVDQIIARRGGIAAYMTDVIRSWDPQTLSDRLELVIGSDLQFIRMNGTLVGFLVGCGLFLITHAFGG